MTVDSILCNQAQNVLIPMRWQMVKSQVFVFHFLFFIPLHPCCDLAYFIKRTILFHVINVTIALEWLSKIFITLVKRSSEILTSCGKKLILYKKVPLFINYCFKNHQMIASLLRNLLNCWLEVSKKSQFIVFKLFRISWVQFSTKVFNSWPCHFIQVSVTIESLQ